jgi:predicted dehydrogenase
MTFRLQNTVPPEGVNRRGFLAGTVAAGAVIGGGLGAFYFGYDKAVGQPLRVGVIGTGDEGSVLLGALNPDFIEVKAIADIRPYSVWRAFHGDHYSETALAARCGLMAKYDWKTETEARRHVKVFGNYQELIDAAWSLKLEAVIIALPLHLHAPAAMAAMQAGLHVLTEKLMAHSIGDCKEMARTARDRKLLLATGHQRHYNILYANAVDAIERDTLGKLHYVRAQWNRGNLPGNDSWQQPMPEKCKPGDRLAKELLKKRKQYQKDLDQAAGASIDAARLRLEQIDAQLSDAVVDAAKYLYEDRSLRDASGKVIYDRPAIEELIRWRLWDRTGAGLMAELGSHQLDAAGIFVHAAHKAATNDPKTPKPHPLNVSAVADRPLFPADRDIEDHVYCIVEFPAPDYNAKDKFARQKKIGVQYAAVNGNGFGGYGEIVFGTKGTLILEKEQEYNVITNKSEKPSSVKVSAAAGPTLDTQASGAPAAVAKKGGEGPKVSCGYTEELEHWAWCIRHRDPANQPRCSPKDAMADAIIALTANIAARQGKRIEFRKEWFDIDSPETPEKDFGVEPAGKKIT